MIRRFISFFLLIAFISLIITPPARVYAANTVLNLPQPGTMVNLSPAYAPMMIKGITLHPENPLMLDFIVGKGESKSEGNALKDESRRLIKYFLACLAIPDNEVWVNLSPYEKDRIITNELGQTQLGQDMLAQDYVLKQLTASLIYPEKNLGRDFWNKVYTKAQQMYGTSQIPMNAFNKVWILADTAKVYENKDTVFVIKSHLKVMMDEDYLALQKNRLPKQGAPKTSSLASKIIREIILPSIEQEVNTGRNFATLRQMYNSMILAVWFKSHLKEAFLNQVYSNQRKTDGINVSDPMIKEKIYHQYLEAYKKGVFNYIKEDKDPTNQTIVRKYFSGGLLIPDKAMIKEASLEETEDYAQASQEKLLRVRTQTPPVSNKTDFAMAGKSLSQLEAEAKELKLDIPSLRVEFRFGVGQWADFLANAIEQERKRLKLESEARELGLDTSLKVTLRLQGDKWLAFLSAEIEKAKNSTHNDLNSSFSELKKDIKGLETFSTEDFLTIILRTIPLDQFTANLATAFTIDNSNSRIEDVLKSFNLLSKENSLSPDIILKPVDSLIKNLGALSSQPEKVSKSALEKVIIASINKTDLNKVFEDAEYGNLYRQALAQNSDLLVRSLLLTSQAPEKLDQAMNALRPTLVRAENQISADLEHSRTELLADIQKDADRVLINVLYYVVLAQGEYLKAKEFSNLTDRLVVYDQILKNIGYIITLPQMSLNTESSRAASEKVNQLWIEVGNEIEMSRVNDIKSLVNRERLGDQLKSRMSEAHIIFKDGAPSIEDLPPDAWSPYSGEIWSPYLIDVLPDLIRKTNLMLDKNDAIIIPEKIGRLSLPLLTALVTDKTPDERLKKFVSIENDVRKDPEQGLKLAADLKWGEIKTRKDFQLFMQDFLNATRLIKWSENWEFKKEGMLSNNKQWLDDTKRKLQLNDLDSKTFAARILSLNIPINMINEVINHQMPNGQDSEKIGDGLIKNGYLGEISMAGGSASRWKPSLGALINRGLINPDEIPDNLPRAQAAYWIGNFKDGGETGVSLMLNNAALLKYQGDNVFISYVLSPYTWRTFMNQTYNYWSATTNKPFISVIPQNSASAQEISGGAMSDTDIPGKVLGHGNVRGWLPAVIDGLKKGIVVSMTRSADTPTIQLNSVQTKEIVGRMSMEALAHVSISNLRSIGQTGGGFVNQNGIPNVIDTAISKKANKNRFVADIDINLFAAFTHFINNAAVLYAVSSPEDHLISWDDVVAITKGEKEPLKQLQQRLKNLTIRQISQLTTNFMNLLPSEFVSKKDTKTFVQWEQVSGMLHGALPRAINERQKQEGIAKSNRLTLAYVDISLADYKTLYGDGKTTPGKYIPTFIEVKAAPDLEAQTDDSKSIIHLLFQRGIFSDTAMAGSSKRTSFNNQRLSKDIRDMFDGLQGQHFEEEMKKLKDRKKKEVLQLRFPTKASPKILPSKRADFAMRGGIDLNAKNLKIESEGQKVNIQFDPAMIAQFKRGDFSGVQIQIMDISPIENIMPLLGLREDDETDKLAKA